MTAEERAREIHLAILNSGHGAFGCIACKTIAAALAAAEEKGRQEERALSEQHWNAGYKNGEKIGREKALEEAEGVAASYEAMLDSDAKTAHESHDIETLGSSTTGASTAKCIKEDIRALRHPATGGEK